MTTCRKECARAGSRFSLNGSARLPETSRRFHESEWVLLTVFGLRTIARILNDDPAESSVLALLLELVREEGPFSRIADTLNTQGFRTRRGTKWTEVDVFKLLPRLIDAAPDLRRTKSKAVNRDS